MAPSSSRGQGEPFRAQTFEAALSVAAGPQSTDFWLFNTLVNIFAFVILQTIPRWADASVGAIQVLTCSRCTFPRVQSTFIDIHAGPAIGGHLVAFIASALKGPHRVDTLAVSAKVPVSSCTFINIYAVIVVRQYEAMVAAAVEGANRVSARAVPTGVSLTLIYVQAHGLICICFEAGVTKAVEASHSVDALAMTAYVRDFLALVSIIALAGGGEAVAGLAVAAVAACSVDAFRVALAHGPVLTLIDIFADQ